MRIVFLIAAACMLMQTPSLIAEESTEPEARLFAVEITVGPNWDSEKIANEQAYFKEHSANLKQLRAAGQIVMGARYSDNGLIVISATSADEVKTMMDKDPSITAGTFTYEVHDMFVFYPWATAD